MQVSSASSSAHELLISSAKSSGRSEHVVSKESVGETRYADRFEKFMQTQGEKATYSFNATTKAEQQKLSSAKTGNTPATDLTTSNGSQNQSVQFTQADVNALTKIFGSSKGDNQFMEQYDLDGNGTIDLQDLNNLLAQLSNAESAGAEEEIAYTQADLDLLLESFGAQTGDESYSEALDLDGDGLIGLADLNTMLANFSTQPQPEGFTQSHIDQLTAAFGASTGDENFVAELDMNSDGTLDLADLNAMLASMSQS